MSILSIRKNGPPAPSGTKESITVPAPPVRPPRHRAAARGEISFLRIDQAVPDLRSC
jgi:hypothetical protein